jgi:conjugative relaxase-like TrwC/TraI family protein
MLRDVDTSRPSHRTRLVLSAVKISAQQLNYYLDYVDAGGEKGVWQGKGADELGLRGDVGDEAFRNLAEGLAPDGGKLLERAYKRGREYTGEGERRPERAPGWDFTFSAPKSVSVLYGIGSDEVQIQVREAHDAAVAAGLHYLESEAGRARRGFGGRDGEVGAGLAIAKFVHKTSRAKDPQLHTHAIVLNVGFGEDKRWTAIADRALFRHRMAAGYLYQAVLRGELTRRIGVEWGRVRTGQAEIVGVPAAVLREFSRRAQQVEARMAKLGQTSYRASRIAVVDTRAYKVAVEFEELQGEWLARAEGLGFSREAVEAALHRQTDQRSEDLTFMAERLVGAGGLTQKRASFTRRDVIRAWSEALQQGASAQDIRRLADELLRRDDVVQLLNPEGEHHREHRYSTQEMLHVEQGIIDRALGRRGSGLGIAVPETVEAALRRRPSISAEQALMVRRLTGDGEGVVAVVAGPGAGKTGFGLDAAREAWGASGIPVLGACLAAEAAAGLQEGAGIQSTTIAGLLVDLEDPRHGGLASGSVLVIDEAGMVDTRTLGRLLGHAEAAGAKVVLVGDDRQLPEIEAGGSFASLVRRLDPIVLTENRRQREEWERRALAEQRAGRSAEAVAAYEEHGRVTVADSGTEAKAAMVAEWRVSRERGEDALMWARTVRNVTDLNILARARMAESGALTGPEMEAGGRIFQAGDWIVCLRNRRHLGRVLDPSGTGVRNGTRGEVVAVDPEGHRLRIRCADGRELTLPADYVGAGLVDHAYALTIHKAQGKTTEIGLLLGTDDIDAQAALVGMSRGRGANRLYVTGEVEASPESHGAVTPRDAVAATVAAWKRPGTKAMAVDEFRDAAAAVDLARTTSTDELRDRRKALAAELVPPTKAGPDLEAAGRAAARAGEDLERAHALVAPAASNPGDAGMLHRRRADSALAAARAAEAAEQLRQAQAAASLAERDLERAQSGAGEHARWLEERREQLTLVATMDRAIAIRREWQATAIQADPPVYITQLLGTAPGDRAGRHRWRQGAMAIEDYRERHVVAHGPDAPPIVQALGERPTPGARGSRREWERTTEIIGDVRRDLALEHARMVEREGPALGR